MSPIDEFVKSKNKDRLFKQKGMTYFIEVAVKVISRLPNVRCYIAGTGKNQESLENLSKKVVVGKPHIFRI